MKYPEYCNSIIDVTKTSYYADNAKKTDCTKTLRMAFDDCFKGYIYGEIYVVFPEEIPLIKSLYFPDGKYLIQ